MITPIEALESRIAPAGVILADYNAVTGELTLTGDGDANGVSIYRVNATTIRVEGLHTDGSDTLLDPDGRRSFEVNRLTKITANFLGGDDELFLTNLSLSALELDGGEGADLFLGDDLTVKGLADLELGLDGGTVEFGGLKASFGALSVASDSGTSDLLLEAAAVTIKGALIFNGSLGTDFVSKGLESNLTIGKGLVFNGGDSGSDTLELSGRGTVKIGKTATGESLIISGGDGSNSVFLGGTFLTLAGFIDFDGLAGASNTLSIGNGQSIVKIGQSAGATAGRSIVFTGGDMEDSLRIEAHNVILAGGIDMDAGGAGSANVDIDGDGFVKIGKIKDIGASVQFAGGADQDDLFLGGHSLVLSGSVNFTGGGGNDTLDIDGNSVSLGKSLEASIFFIGGEGADRLDLQGGKISALSDIAFDGGNDNDSADFTELHALSARNIGFTGEGGDDDFDLDVFLLTLAGNLGVSGQDGNDAFFVRADGLIKGNVSLSLDTGDGSQEASLLGASGLVGNLRVGGSLEVYSAGDSLSPDNIRLEELTIAKHTDISLGEGESFVNLENIFAKGEVTIRTYGEDDTVLIEQSNYFGPSIFSKPVSIELSNGNDELGIGDSTVAALKAHNTARFLAAVTIAGGTGMNVHNADLLTANFFAQPPTITGI